MKSLVVWKAYLTFAPLKDKRTFKRIKKMSEFNPKTGMGKRVAPMSWVSDEFKRKSEVAGFVHLRESKKRTEAYLKKYTCDRLSSFASPERNDLTLIEARGRLEKKGCHIFYLAPLTKTAIVTAFDELYFKIIKTRDENNIVLVSYQEDQPMSIQVIDMGEKMFGLVQVPHYPNNEHKNNAGM